MTSILVFIGLLLTVLTSGRTTRASASTDNYDWGEKEEVLRWNVEEFPNPQRNPKFCNRFVPSNVCDPDRILKKEEADHLDKAIRRLYNDTPCICPDCSSSAGGMVIGVAVMEHIFLPYNEHHSNIIREFADELRKRWSLGQCQNDIVIVLVTGDRMSFTSVGPGISSYISSEEIRIFRENREYFTNKSYYEGLLSMVQSYYDLSQSIKFDKEVEQIDPGLVAGIIVGVIMLIVLITLVGCALSRRISRSPSFGKDSWDGDPSLSWKRKKGNHHRVDTKYEICNTQEMGEKSSAKKRGYTENNNHQIITITHKEKVPEDGDETLATNDTLLSVVAEVEIEGNTCTKDESDGDHELSITIANVNNEPELHRSEREDRASSKGIIITDI